MITLLKANLATEKDRLAFVANPQPIINCANGELWIKVDANFGCGLTSQIHFCATASTSNMTRKPDADMAGRFRKS